jgi:hypothetical protein
MANTLAYNGTATNTTVKSFIVLAPGLLLILNWIYENFIRPIDVNAFL